MPLFHFTCDHAAPLIMEAGVVTRALERMVAKGQTPPWQATVTWWTDQPHPHALSLGVANLTGKLTCDRLAYRFRALDTDAMLWWPRAVRSLGVQQDERDEIEGALGVRPAHWYVALRPVEVIHEQVPL